MNFFFIFILLRSVFVCVLAYKGAPLLADVSMCVDVHLNLCVMTPGSTLHEHTLSNL